MWDYLPERQKSPFEMRCSESAALQEMLAKYPAEIRKGGLFYQSYRKTFPDSWKVGHQTISKEQDKALQKLADKTGRSILDLVREAVESF